MFDSSMCVYVVIVCDNLSMVVSVWQDLSGRSCKLMVEGTDCSGSLGQGPSCSLNSWALAIYLRWNTHRSSHSCWVRPISPRKTADGFEGWRNYQMPILWESMRKSDIPYSPDETECRVDMESIISRMCVYVCLSICLNSVSTSHNLWSYEV